MKGPDILASTNGRLTAYFILDKRVNRLPIGFLSNVVLSRLALPPGTSFILVVGGRASVRGSDVEIFEEISPVSTNELSKFPAGSMRESRGGESVDSLRKVHNQRFARAWASPRESDEKPWGIVERPTSMRDANYRRPRIRTPYMDFHQGRFIITSPEVQSRVSVRDLFARATNAAVQADYWLDLGVPGVEEVAQVIRSRGAHLALHESHIPFPVEARKFDSLKPFRAAAFAGFAIGRGEDSDDI